MNLVFGFLLSKQPASARELLERYRAAWEENRDRPGRLNGHVAEPLYGNLRHVVVAETDAEAHALARPALKAWFESFNHIWVTQRGEEYYPSDVDAFIGQGHLILGSPTTVRRQVAQALDELGGNYFGGAFAFGSLSGEHALRSMELFASEVIPALATPDD
jgi:alkanesulfonate monooxygenase SsuD/methylene tetrahydromethanopterin reductase-like flavin-dependent oxidoreductase (luciferase family)